MGKREVRGELDRAVKEYLDKGGTIKKLEIKKVPSSSVSAQEYMEFCFDNKISLKDI